MLPRPPISTLFPYTTLFRSGHHLTCTVRVRDITQAFPLRTEGDPAPGVANLKCPSDRKSTRLNSSHITISYAVFCLKKKKNIEINTIVSSVNHTYAHSCC